MEIYLQKQMGENVVSRIPTGSLLQTSPKVSGNLREFSEECNLGILYSSSILMMLMIAWCLVVLARSYEPGITSYQNRRVASITITTARSSFLSRRRVADRSIYSFIVWLHRIMLYHIDNDNFLSDRRVARRDM